MNTASKISRRQFLKIVAAGSVVGLAALKLGQISEPQTVSATRLLMGTVINLTIVSDDRTSAEAAIDATLNRMAELEAILSRHRPDSQLSRLNETGVLAQAAQPLLDLLAQSDQISRRTEGAFDITIKPLLDLYQQHQQQGGLPNDIAIHKALALVDYRNINRDGARVSFSKPGMAVTLDGIGKGYIVDAGVETLRQAGFSNVLVEAGGDLLASGEKKPQDPWQIGIQSPRQAQSGLITRIDVRNQAAATSGDYMQFFSNDFRHHHIIDPRTGYSAPDLASATVLAPSAALADGLATAMMVLGANKGLGMLEAWPDVEVYLVTKEMEVAQTSGLA